MRKVLEVTVFGGLAIGLHVMLMADWPDQGAEAGGVGGDALVSIAGASPQIETMVATWDRPPQTQVILENTQPLLDTVAPQAPMPSVRIDAAPNAVLKMAAMQAPDVPEPPKPDVKTAPPPPPEPEPLPEPEPEPEPKPEPVAKPEPKPEPKPKPKQVVKKKPKPKAKASDANRAASAGSAQQRAAGSGGSAHAGNKGKAAVSTLSSGQVTKLTAVWGARIRAKIAKRKRRPSGTRATGVVKLRVVVNRSGQLNSVSVRRSSGDAKLDAAALSAAKRAGRFPAAPKGLTKASYAFAIDLVFKR